jgi:hypothetical protein
MCMHVVGKHVFVLLGGSVPSSRPAGQRTEPSSPHDVLWSPHGRKQAAALLCVRLPLCRSSP